MPSKKAWGEKCDRCGLSDVTAIELNDLPAKIRESAAEGLGLALRQTACYVCIRAAGEPLGFSRRYGQHFVYPCASRGYDCPLQTTRDARISLRPIPEGTNPYLCLGVPGYAPQRCLCVKCYARFQPRSDNTIGSPTSPEQLTAEPIGDGFLVSAIEALPASGRRALFTTLLEYLPLDELRTTFATRASRTQLSRLTAIPESRPERRKTLADLAAEYWEDVSEPCQSRRSIRNAGERVDLRAVRVPFYCVWQDFQSENGSFLQEKEKETRQKKKVPVTSKAKKEQKTYSCGTCGVVGHNARTCPQASDEDSSSSTGSDSVVEFVDNPGTQRSVNSNITPSTPNSTRKRVRFSMSPESAKKKH